jgi:hypothetical protein
VISQALLNVEVQVVCGLTALHVGLVAVERFGVVVPHAAPTGVASTVF